MAVKLYARLPHYLYRIDAQTRLGLSARRNGYRFTFSEVIKESLRHLASARIMDTDKQYFLHLALNQIEDIQKVVVIPDELNPEQCLVLTIV